VQFVAQRKDQQVIIGNLVSTPPETVTAFSQYDECPETRGCATGLIKATLKPGIADKHILRYELFYVTQKAPGAQKPEIEVPVLHLVNELFEITETGIENYLHNRKFCGN
jgi:hypothetical protein